MSKTSCYLDGKLLHCCGARVKIEIETLNLEDIFFLFISNHMSLGQHKNSKIPTIRTTLSELEGHFYDFPFLSYHI